MNAHLKIVHIVPALTKGGAERVAVDLANASARDGHSVTLVACWKVDEKVLRARLEPAVRVVYMINALGGMVRRYLAGIGWTLSSRGWLAEQDVLHLHLTQPAILGTLLYAMRSFGLWRGPVIVETIHSVGMNISGRAQAFNAWNCKRRDGIAMMALDSYWRGFIQSNPKLVCEFIPNGVSAPVGAAPAESVRAYLDEIGIPVRATRIIGTVGQFRPDRQPLTIARILIDVLKKTPENVHALMCGSGSELEPVRALVEQEGLSSRFTLPGVVNEPRLAMSAMSLYLTINVGEITGIASIEAAFCGTALVALQMNPDAIERGKEWIWSSSDPAQVSKRIAEIIEDDSKILEIAGMQHEYAIAKHDINRVHLRYLSFYAGAIARKSAMESAR